MATNDMAKTPSKTTPAKGKGATKAKSPAKAKSAAQDSTAAKATTSKRKKGVKTIAREYFESVNTHDVDEMMKFWEPGGYAYIHGMATLRAPEGYRDYFGSLFRAFPDVAFEILDIVASGEQAAVRWRATATFTGPGKFEGVSPTGAGVEMEGFDLLTIRDGKVRENRAYTNAAEIARQLGAMPPAGSIGERLMLGSVNARTTATTAVRKLRKRR